MTLTETERFRHLQFDGAFDNTPGEKTLRQTFGPRYQLFLIGCGQVSQYLAEMAKALDYQVVVCDPTRKPDGAVAGRGRSTDYQLPRRRY